MCAPLAFTPCAVIEYGLLALFLNVITICSPASALIMGPMQVKTKKTALSGFNKQQNTESKVELYPEFPSVAGHFAVSSARWRCHRCILDTRPFCNASQSCNFLSLDIYCQDWKTGDDKIPFLNNCNHNSQARLWHTPFTCLLRWCGTAPAPSPSEVSSPTRFLQR